jgi:hypothetical protein
VVNSVTIRPPSNGTFDGTRAHGGEVDLKRKAALVGRVRPHTMVTGSDTETSVEVVKACPEGSVELERNPVGGDEADDGNDDDECGVEPIDMLVPVGPGYREVGNVRLVALQGVDLGGRLASKRNIVFGAIREGGGSLGVHGGRRHIDDGACGVAEVG